MNQTISLGWMEIKENKWGHDLFHPHSSHFFILQFDASSSEQIKKREKWKLIIQKAKAHPEL
jgi:hypothetical protein